MSKGLLSSAALGELAPNGPSSPAPMEHTGRSEPTNRFRPDIEGLRAVAVLLVIGFHAGIPFLPGGYVGVDVFFVISGFLITSKLRREYLETGRLKLSRFYAGRARRLLPSATLVLLSVVAASMLVLPWLEQPQIGADVTSAALFVSNWHFASESTQYMASANGVSPVLNFWSLSVEEQFYFVWPILMLLMALIGRRFSRRVGAQLVVCALSALFAISLWFSVTQTSQEGPWAYFGLQTRLWELAAGALIAFAINRLPRVSSRVAVTFVSTGLLLIAISAVVFSGRTVFPGSMALIPVLGAVLVIVFGGASTTTGTHRLLGSAPMQYVGRRSYSLYLWHWPVLVFAGLVATQNDAVGGGASTESSVAPPAAAALAIALSVGLAAGTYRFLESPVRYSSWVIPRTRVTLVGAVGLIVLSCLAASTLSATSVAQDSAQDPIPGIAQQLISFRDSSIKAFSGKCFGGYDDSSEVDLKDCVFGKKDSPVKSMLLGDSHAAMWAPALDRVGRKEGWSLSEATRSSCPWWDALTLDPRNGRTYDSCQQWRQSAMQAAKDSGRLSTIYVASTETYLPLSLIADDTGAAVSPQQARNRQVDAIASSLGALQSFADRVVILRAGPNANRDEISGCLQNHLEDPGSCVLDRSKATAHIAAAADMENSAIRRVDSGRVHVVATADVMCPKPLDRCPTVTKHGVVIYENDSHVTAAAAEDFADDLALLLSADHSTGHLRPGGVRKS